MLGVVVNGSLCESLNDHTDELKQFFSFSNVNRHVNLNMLQLHVISYLFLSFSLFLRGIENERKTPKTEDRRPPLWSSF